VLSHFARKAKLIQLENQRVPTEGDFSKAQLHYVEEPSRQFLIMRAICMAAISLPTTSLPDRAWCHSEELGDFRARQLFHQPEDLRIAFPMLFAASPLVERYPQVHAVTDPLPLGFGQFAL
jgi:hypothetical protein